MKKLLLIIKFFVIGVFLTILAWLGVHILAVFGIFLVVAYIFWWIGFPKYRYGKFIPSVLLIIAASLTSTAIVFAESRVLTSLGFTSTAKTATFAIPAKDQYRIGEIFPMKLEIRNIKTPVNAVQTDLGFDSDKVEVVDISTKESFANVFIQKQIDNNGGWARLTGGLPNPGYFSDSGLFATVYFKAKNAGLAEIKFLSSSMVLANDGGGTNILKDFPSASYLIIPDRIGKEEAEAQEELISERNVTVLGVSTKEGERDGAQLKFFDDGSVNVGASVLAASSLNDSEGNASTSDDKVSGSAFIELIVKLDNVILSVWAKIFNLGN